MSTPIEQAARILERLGDDGCFCDGTHDPLLTNFITVFDGYARDCYLSDDLHDIISYALTLVRDGVPDTAYYEHAAECEDCAGIPFFTFRHIKRHVEDTLNHDLDNPYPFEEPNRCKDARLPLLRFDFEGVRFSQLITETEKRFLEHTGAHPYGTVHDVSLATFVLHQHSNFATDIVPTALYREDDFAAYVDIACHAIMKKYRRAYLMWREATVSALLEQGLPEPALLDYLASFFLSDEEWKATEMAFGKFTKTALLTPLSSSLIERAKGLASKQDRALDMLETIWNRSDANFKPRFEQ